MTPHFRFGAGEVGALFFDPARRYAQLLHVPRPWSIRYVDLPFVAREPSPAARSEVSGRSR